MTEATDYAEARRALNANLGSWGPKLEEIAADVLTQVDEIDLEELYPEDRCAEIADEAVPIYTSEVFEIVPELAGYEISDSGLLPDVADIERIAQTMIYDIASNIAGQRLHERQERANA